VPNTVAVTATSAYLAVHGSSTDAMTRGLVHGYATATGLAAILLSGTAAAVACFLRTHRRGPSP
jgi:hypothetical protein